MKSVVLASIIVLASGQIWIPSEEPGFVYSNCASDDPIRIEAFLDPLCVDSKAWYPSLLELVDSSTSDRIQLWVHMNPLPYHTYAFTAAKGAFVYKSVTGESPFDWITAVFNAMDNFSSSRTFNETTESVLNRFADLGVKLGADKEDFYSRLIKYNKEHRDAVLGWKYGASRGVHSTPTIFINGVLLQGEMPNIREMSAKISALLDE